MKFCLSTLLLLGVTATTTAAKTCKKEDQLVRKEWRALSLTERDSYIAAVKCLFTSPSKMKGGSTGFVPQNRYEDFVALHIWATTPAEADFSMSGPGIHFNGVFLPWHRYTVWNYESTLRNECGYTGAHPYWDWTLDTSTHNNASFHDSPIWSTTHGFGGNGINGTIDTDPSVIPDIYSGPAGSCVEDGPFAHPSVPLRSLGFGYNLTTPNPHCMMRNVMTKGPSGADACLNWEKMVKPILETPAGKFANFSMSFDTGSFPQGVPPPLPNSNNTGQLGCMVGIHGGGHGGVGGEMLNTWSSTNDPLFFMHHAQLDRLWALWQTFDAKNVWAIGGSVYQNGTGGQVGLDYTIQMLDEIAPDVPVRDVMDTTNADGKGVLCYRYEEDGQYVPPKSAVRRGKGWARG